MKTPLFSAKPQCSLRLSVIFSFPACGTKQPVAALAIGCGLDANDTHPDPQPPTLVGAQHAAPQPGNQIAIRAQSRFSPVTAHQSRVTSQ
jgi:hypothetical protein